MIGYVIFAGVIFGLLGIIFLPDFLSRKKCNKLLVSLKESGFQSIPVKSLHRVGKVVFADAAHHIPFPFYGKKNKKKILSALSKKISPSRSRYIFFTKLRLTKRVIYTVTLTDICTTGFPCKVAVFPTMTSPMESMMLPFMKERLQRVWGVKEVSKGLDDSFKEKFIVAAERDDVILPVDLQKYLLSVYARQVQADMWQISQMFFSQHGWSLDTKNIDKKALDQLIEVADTFERYVIH